MQEPAPAPGGSAAPAAPVLVTTPPPGAAVRPDVAALRATIARLKAENVSLQKAVQVKDKQVVDKNKVVTALRQTIAGKDDRYNSKVESHSSYITKMGVAHNTCIEQLAAANAKLSCLSGGGCDIGQVGVLGLGLPRLAP